MAVLGDRVIFTVPSIHETKTVKGDKEVLGSIYHAEMRQFAGMVGRVHEDGSASLLIFPPNGAPRWVDAVPGEHFEIKG